MSAYTPDAGLGDADNRVGKPDSGTSSIGAGATGGAVSGRGTGTSSVGSGAIVPEAQVAGQEVQVVRPDRAVPSPLTPD